MINIFKHLLPRSKAWSITATKKLRSFFQALSISLIEDIKEYYDTIWSSIDPQETTDLKRWEYQFGLLDTGITEPERRDRLDAAWAATGGQSPSYIQETLQANGFNVYVHEWWEPGTEQEVGTSGPPGTIRNPLDYLKQVYPGDETPLGYPLVNKFFETAKNEPTQMGEPLTEMGESIMLMGEYSDLTETEKSYTIPSDSAYWPYFMYIGGETFPLRAEIPISRKNEFEALCLKICPEHLWIGVIVYYYVEGDAYQGLSGSWYTTDFGGTYTQDWGDQ